MPESAETRKIMWKPFFDAMQAAGLLDEPENCRRLVIDAEVGKALRITYHRYGDTRVLDVVRTAMVPVQDGHESEAVVR